MSKPADSKAGHGLCNLWARSPPLVFNFTCGLRMVFELFCDLESSATLPRSLHPGFINLCPILFSQYFILHQLRNVTFWQGDGIEEAGYLERHDHQAAGISAQKTAGTRVYSLRKLEITYNRTQALFIPAWMYVNTVLKVHLQLHHFGLCLVTI